MYSGAIEVSVYVDAAASGRGVGIVGALPLLQQAVKIDPEHDERAVNPRRLPHRAATPSVNLCSHAVSIVKWCDTDDERVGARC